MSACLSGCFSGLFPASSQEEAGSKESVETPSIGSNEKKESIGGQELIGKQYCRVQLAVDGEVMKVDVDPVVSLSDYLRGRGKTCVKIGCGEGGCGACTVMIGQWGAGASQPEYRTVNACLVQLAACDGMAIITTHGLGNKRTGFHPIQERLADNNGSQCGFCSPGMVMSMYGWLKQTDNNPKKEDGEKCLDGNLCRCTGYRSILKAYETLVDEKVDDSKLDLSFPEELKHYTPRPLYFSGTGKEWFAPVHMRDVFMVLKQVPLNAKVQLTAGNTARGIYKTEDQVDVFVDLRGIPELQEIKGDDNGISFGAAVTIAKFITVLEEFYTKKGDKGAPGFPSICDHARKIAGNQVRNWGTIAGNLMITKTLGFQSDLATILSAAGASVVLAKGSGEDQRISLSEFLAPNFHMPSVKSCLMKSVVLPFSAGEIFKSFKVAKRPQNSHAIVNAAFRVKKQGNLVESATMIFGALVSSPAGPVGPFTANKTEAVLRGQEVTTMLFEKALKALVTEPWWPKDKYEQQLAKSYLCRLFAALSGKDRSDVNIKTTLSHTRPVASYGEQNVNWGVDEKLAPISHPLNKTNAKLQCAGEAEYCADISEPRDTLFGAYVLIDLPNVKVTKVDKAAALKMPGVVAYVDASDIPANGANLGDMENQWIFVPVGEVTQCPGQPAGMILADTQKHAEMAAKKVKVTTTKSDETTCLTAEQCGEAGRSIKKLTHMGPFDPLNQTRGDAEKALKDAQHTIKGTLFCAAQRHFYMEPNNCLAVPEADGQMTVYHSTQVANWTQVQVAKALGVLKNKIVAKAPLAGGGFGGKCTRNLHVACAAAVAANKLGKPVKFVLNRNVDMVMTGSRHATTADYEAGFSDDGRITSLKVKTLLDTGFNWDVMNPANKLGGTIFECMLLNEALEQAYGIPNMDANAEACFTHKPSCTTMRAPGFAQATCIIETVMDHIAADLKMDPQVVREVNIFQDKAEQAAVANDKHMDAGWQMIEGKTLLGGPIHNFPMPGLWEHLKKTANYMAMKKEVDDFNKVNTWRKRGISMTPQRKGTFLRRQVAMMCVYKDGSVLISCDGTEIGQGLWTKVQQFAAHHLSQICKTTVPIENIRVQPVATDRIAEGSPTFAGSTSQGCGEAVRDCCNQFKEMLQKHIDAWPEDKKEEMTFAGLCEKAACEVGGGWGGEVMQYVGVNKFSEDFAYHSYGACVSTVEIDVLTGETTILASKLCYDCGRSLNPLLDVGQCEGAFMQGVGFFLREEIIEDERTGQLLSDGTWEYKIPCAQDSPIQFDVEFYPRPFEHERAVVSSKAASEPPLILSTSVFCAVRHAIAAARKEFGHEDFFRLDAPATPRVIALLCNPKLENFKV